MRLLERFLIIDCLRLLISCLVSREQLSFIKKCQILDGPIILNKVVAWEKEKRKHLMIFKVDFEKAYDSVLWNYLLEIMRIMGFGSKWCSWIHPTNEFDIHSRLHLGDPLSPFLFILVM